MVVGKVRATLATPRLRLRLQRQEPSGIQSARPSVRAVRAVRAVPCVRAVRACVCACVRVCGLQVSPRRERLGAGRRATAWRAPGSRERRRHRRGSPDDETKPSTRCSRDVAEMSPRQSRDIEASPPPSRLSPALERVAAVTPGGLSGRSRACSRLTPSQLLARRSQPGYEAPKAGSAAQPALTWLAAGSGACAMNPRGHTEG